MQGEPTGAADASDNFAVGQNVVVVVVPYAGGAATCGAFKKERRRTAAGRPAKQGRATWRPFPLPIRKGQRSGCPSARVDGLEPQCILTLPAAGRQAIFLGATEPRAARPKVIPAARAMLVGQVGLTPSTAISDTAATALKMSACSRRIQGPVHPLHLLGK
jgi:hypothetical protein